MKLMVSVSLVVCLASGAALANDRQGKPGVLTRDRAAAKERNRDPEARRARRFRVGMFFATVLSAGGSMLAFFNGEPTIGGALGGLTLSLGAQAGGVGDPMRARPSKEWFSIYRRNWKRAAVGTTLTVLGGAAIGSGAGAQALEWKDHILNMVPEGVNGANVVTAGFLSLLAGGGLSTSVAPPLEPGEPPAKDFW